MLGIDTNVLVRFLVRDDENQFEKVRKLIRREVAAGHRVFCQSTDSQGNGMDAAQPVCRATVTFDKKASRLPSFMAA